MKKIMLVMLVIVFMATPVFSQGLGESADDAAKAARESLTARPDSSSSQIEWLNKVINVVNMKKLTPKETN